MLAQEYFQFKKEVNEKSIIFSFVGYVSENILVSLGDALKQKMALEETDINTTKRVFSVFVEQVQNIIRYSAERIGTEKAEMSSGVISVGCEQGKFFVICGNTIIRKQVTSLQERLNILRTLDKAAIKAYYKEKLKEPPEGDSKGATIGLIEIARRSSQPIEFDFMDIDAQTTFFCLKAFI